MKLASLQNGTPDGELIVVSRDLTRAVRVAQVAPNLLRALESWNLVCDQLEECYRNLNERKAAGTFRFDPAAVLAPLPRAPQWLDGSAFLSHGQRMVKAFGLPDDSLRIEHPLMYQGCSDSFLGAQAVVPLPSEEDGIDLEGELAVITGAVRMGSTPEDCESCIRLLALVDDVSLRNLLFGEMSLGFGMIHCKPTSVFSPVCVTPDELGDNWQNGRVHLSLTSSIDGELLGSVSGAEMHFSFGELIAHAARTRLLSPGTIVGSGTFSNADASRGTACLAEKRAIEKLAEGEVKTPWMRFGSRVHMDMLDRAGKSIFGAIDHTFASAD